MTHRNRMAIAGALVAALLSPVPAFAAERSVDTGAPVTRTVEKGHLASCTGQDDGLDVTLELYENSTFGAHTNVSVRTAETEYVGGGPADAGLFGDGAISARVAVAPQEEMAPSSETAVSETTVSETAVISGSYAPAGPRERVHDVVEEPWGKVVTKGWRTPLSAGVTVRVLGREATLTCHDAYAFDLRVLRFGTGGS
jgi:hypothetical protein